MKRLDAILRRALDIVTALMGLLLLSPFLLVIALLVKISSKGPVFYRARRVGQGGEPFNLLKFRTMIIDADRIGPGITLEEDPRITSVGRWLRSHRLDEIPQLWNVLVGDMSLVGPRPEDPRYVSYYTPEQRRVLVVRPGITGPAQIVFRNEAERLRHSEDPEATYINEIMPAKLEVDLAYLRQRTFWTDLGILLRTLRIYVGNRILVPVDVLSIILSYILSFAIRFDNIMFLEQLALYWPVLVPLLIIKLVVFDVMGLYRRMWRYASVRELISVVGAVAFSSTLGGALILILWVWPTSTFVTGFPRSVIAIDAMLTLLLAGGVRFTARWQQEMRSTAAQAEPTQGQEQRALIAGAGDAGAMVAREMLRNPQVGYQLIGFLDDDPDKQGLRVHGMPVVGTLADLPRCVEELLIEEILIAMPTAPGDAIRRIFDLARSVNVQVRTLPGYYELVSGQASVQRAREVRLEDLLRRAPAPMDLSGVAGYLTGQVVMVTGAGGSIGSEICRQVARFGPAQLLLLGHGEGSIYRIHMEMRRSFPDVTCVPVLANVRDRKKLDWIIDRYRPEVIFHTAAYKHVPLSELNADEVVLNNVIGTHNLVNAAEDAGVPHLVFVSTDKAVEPVNMMGMTKCVGEWIVQHAARRSGLAYVAVRFGNVLGSKGSVVPLFQKQIIAGGPVTVTHPEVTRYFMTIPEAVRLVLQAAALGGGGEVFVLDMGEPVRIYELACDLIHLYGMEPERDISIVFTGLRPGEKLHEALYTEEEAVQPTSHPDIRIATGEIPLTREELERSLVEMEHMAQDNHRSNLRNYLAHLTLSHQNNSNEREPENEID